MDYPIKLQVDKVAIQNVSIKAIDPHPLSRYFLPAQKEKREFDAVILDPPRKGCTIDSLKEAYRLSKNYIIYVSCNPATLARDLKQLCQMGCTVESIQPFDMFCHTYHVENVAIIKVTNKKI